MKVERLEDYKRAPKELLLLADPCLETVMEYLITSEIFSVNVEGITIGVVILQQKNPKMFEIMNLAVNECYQKQGIGRKLIAKALEYAQNQGAESVKIATGNSSIHQLQLYQSCGFVIDKIIKDYFIDYYPEPIYEEGIQCRDRIELLKRF